MRFDRESTIPPSTSLGQKPVFQISRLEIQATEVHEAQPGRGSRSAKRGKVAREWCRNVSELPGQESGKKSLALEPTLFRPSAALLRTSARDFLLSLARRLKRISAPLPGNFAPFSRSTSLSQAARITTSEGSEGSPCEVAFLGEARLRHRIVLLPSDSLSVLKRCVPKTLAFAFGLRLRSVCVCVLKRGVLRRVF